MTSDPARRGDRVVDTIAWALGLGWAGALALMVWRLHPYVGAGFPRVFLHGGVLALDDALPWAAGLTLLWVLVARLSGGRLPRPPALGPAGRPILYGLMLATLGFWAVGLGSANRPHPPNVIVVLVDVLRADHLGAYGYERPTTPNMDRLAADGVLFEHAVSSSSFTKTSVASLFTGLHPHHHGVYKGDKEDTEDRIRSDVLAPGLTTLAESLRELGWFTASWVTNAHLRAYMGFDQGFVDYHDQPGSVRRILASHRRWRERVGRVDPYFAYFHIIDLHGPYRPKKEYAGRYGEYDRDWASLDSAAYRKAHQAIRKGQLVPQPAAIEQLRADYDAVLTYVDHRIGELLDELRATGRYDDSLIVLTADHGDAFMEHGLIAHSSTPYDELTHVPLILKLPGQRHAGRRVARQVQLVDLAPTLIELAGGDPGTGFDGTSLVPFLGEAAAEPARPVAISEQSETVAIRTDRWKYIERGAEGSELYDLEADPGEQRNVIAEHPDAARRFRAMAEDVARKREDREIHEVEVDPDTLEGLRALGYID